MQQNMLENVQVVIRSAHERTEALCGKLIRDQGIPESNIIVIHEVPFTAALRKGFSIGIECGKKWTLFVDADLLLRPGSIIKLIEIAEKQPDNVCEVQGLILDKFWSGPRPAAVHLYRTKLLSRAIKKIPASQDAIRPEYYTLQAMKKDGYDFVIKPILVGLHDFEQYYRDIFRKCLVHSVKHQPLLYMFTNIWRQGAKEDLDYIYALKGLAKGIEHLGNVQIDVQDEIYKLMFDNPNSKEKESLDLNDWNLEKVEDIITHWKIHESFMENYPYSFGLENKRKVIVRQLSDKYQKIGIFRFIPYLFAWILIKTGLFVERKVDKKRK